MIDIPGIYVGRFKDDPNQSTMLMKNGDTPTYTDDNWANVESTGTIWRYNAKAGEWVDTGLEEILVEEVSGTKEIVAEGTVPWKLQGLNVYGKSTQASTTGAQLFPMTEDSYSSTGLTATKQSDGSYLVNGTPADAYEAVYYNDGVILEPGEYYISSDVSTQVLYAQVAITRNDETSIYINKGFTIDGSESSIVFTVQISESMEPLNNIIIKPMLNAGSTALPWEPYTGGKPSPSPDYPQEIVTAGSDGSIDITVSDGADQSQQLSIQTPNGLPGIPVDSGGNFTDADGQQWVCDEVDFERGVYVQRIEQVEFDGSSDELWRISTNDITKRNYFWITVEKTALRYNNDDMLLCSAFPHMTYGYAGPSGENTASFQSNNLNFTCSTSLFSSVDELKQYLTENWMTLVYVIATPIETPLSPEELTAYAALMSYDGNTVISTDEDVSGISAKVVTDVISKNEWFDPYAELALYYKALAGFESLNNLPMPHSRESSLVRKLLDSSYELWFSVNENSSRNERYLWDLINGTSTMLTNVPKSDTEKFLHAMIGGTVEEYPVVDTELDYWMDKCVHYMNSNGNIGG